MGEPQLHISKWKKPVWYDYILYGSNYMTFCKEHKAIETVKKLPGVWKEKEGLSRWNSQWSKLDNISNKIILDYNQKYK